MHDPYAWTLDFEALVLVPALAIGYFVAIRRFPADRRRVACFAAGLLLILAAFVTPLHMLSMHYLLSAHLLQNVVLAEWAPALCVLGLPPALAAAAGKRRTVRFLTHPYVSAPTLDRHVLRLARPCRLRRGTPASVEPDPRRARVLLRDRLPLLVAGASERAASAHSRQPRDLPVCRIRARQPTRPAARADPERRLPLLHPCASSLGPLPADRPADRRSGDGARAGDRPLRCQCVLFLRFLGGESRADAFRDLGRSSSVS